MNNSKVKFIFITVFLILILQACNRLWNHSWSDDVSEIVYSKCTPCHNNSNNGHFKLLTYTDFKSKAAMIKFAIENNFMPPWLAEKHYGEFAQDLSLSNDEKDILLSWIESGCPKGTRNVPVPQYENSFYGKPDWVVKVPPIHIKGDGKDMFLIVKIPFELPFDTMAQAIEFVPSRSNFVHHANGDLITYSIDKNIFEGENIIPTQFALDMINVYSRMKIPNSDGSYPNLYKSAVNYLPGVYATYYPEDIGGIQLKKKNVFLINDLHYGGSDKDVWDSSVINIYFRKKTITRKVEEFQLGTLGVSPIIPRLIIQPNTVSKHYSKFKVELDISLLTINPHMHLLGRSFRGFAIDPNQDTIKLINIPQWNFNWQYFYTFKHPVKIPKGSEIWCEGIFDNTKDNMLNPNNPPKVVSDNNRSMSSKDEMFQFIINYVPYKIGDEKIDLEKNKN